MSAIFAFVRKDLRRLRWPWLGWLGCFIAKLALGAWCVAGPGFNETEMMRVNVVLTALAALIGGVLVVWLVQADSLRSVHAFWRTRPISGGQLLVAKALAAFLLFGLAPVLLALPWWLFNGMGASGVAWSVAEMLLTHAAVLAPVFLIAALVDTVGRAVLWSFVQFGFLICLPILAETFFGSMNPWDVDSSLAINRVVPALLVVALGLPVLIGWQFVRRRTVAVAVGLLALQLAAFGIARFSPYSLLHPSADWAEARPELASGASLQAPVVYLDGSPVRAEGRGMVTLRSRWPVVGLPRELVVFPHLTSLSITDNQGARVATKGFYAWPDAPLQLGAVLPLLRREQAAASAAPAIWVDFTVDQARATELKRGSLKMEVGMQVELFRPRLVFEQALASGAWIADEHGGLRFAVVHATQSGVHIEYVVTRPKSLLLEVRDYGRGAASNVFPVSGYADYVIFPSEPRREPSSLLNVRAELRILGVTIKRRAKELSPWTVARDGVGRPETDDIGAWSAGLRVARIAYRNEAAFPLGGRAEGLVIEKFPEKTAEK